MPSAAAALLSAAQVRLVPRETRCARACVTTFSSPSIAASPVVAAAVALAAVAAAAAVTAFAGP